MSETPTATATRPKAPAKGAGKKYAGLTRNQWLITGGVFAVALAYILWKRHQAAATGTASQTATNQGSNECTDANGNPVDCNEAFAQELAAMQNALDQLGANSGAGGGGSAGGGGTSGSGSTDTGTGATGTTQPNPATGSTSASGGTATATQTAWAYPAPANLRVTRQTSKGVSLSWNAVTGPQGQKPASYTVATYDSSGKEVDQFTPAGTSTSEYGRGGGGLPKGSYHTNVWANGGPKAPPHATVSYTLSG